MLLAFLVRCVLGMNSIDSLNDAHLSFIMLRYGRDAGPSGLMRGDDESDNVDANRSTKLFAFDCTGKQRCRRWRSSLILFLFLPTAIHLLLLHLCTMTYHFHFSCHQHSSYLSFFVHEQADRQEDGRTGRQSPIERAPLLRWWIYTAAESAKFDARSTSSTWGINFPFFAQLQQLYALVVFLATTVATFE
eukprot:GHVU01100155.1.p1 GENE.GHVU01100155.1~~GHVU01100155.1.p1  ORF type:complete len:190 (+),score=10.42 GHVU01100155.1:163-732(+)